VIVDEQQQVIAALLAFGILAFFGGFAAMMRRRMEAGRLKRYVSAHVTGTNSAAAALSPMAAAQSGLALMLNRKIGRSSLGQRLQQQLTRSGLSMTANHFILGQVAAGSLLYLVARFGLIQYGETIAFFLSFLLPGLAFVVPRFALKMMEDGRVKKFDKQLAQAVDVMAGALQAGSSLTQAFEMVGREMPDPIGQEFSQLMNELRFSVPLEEGLQHMLERVNSAELDMLVTAINIQYRVGGNLTHILKSIAHTIRERVRIRGEISTLTAQARLSSYIISGMPVVVVLALMVISPQYIMKLFDPGVTRIMLLGGCMGICSGYYVMRRIAAIEV
jgi:tight adherence protein B